MLTKITLAFFLFGSLLFTACKKESSNSVLENEAAVIESSVNKTEADAAYDEVFIINMSIGSETGEELGITAGAGVFWPY